MERTAGETHQLVLPLPLLSPMAPRTMELVVAVRPTATLTVVPPIETRSVTKVTVRATRALADTRVSSLPLADRLTHTANSNRHTVNLVINSRRMANRPTETSSRTAMVVTTVERTIHDLRSMAATATASQHMAPPSLRGLGTARLPTATLLSVREDRLLTTLDLAADKEVTVIKTRLSIEQATGPERRSMATLVRLPTIHLLLSSMVDKDMAETIPAMMDLLADTDTKLYVYSDERGAKWMK